MSKNASVDENEIKAVLTQLLRHHDLSADVGLSACRHLNGSGRYDCSEWGLKELLSRFAGSRHVGRVHAERLQAAIQRLPPADALDYADKFFDANDVIESFDDDTRKSVQLLLWEQAATHHKESKWLSCLSWYDQSLRLFLFGMTVERVKEDQVKSQNVAKLHRNRVSCLLSLGRVAEAEDAARKALEFDRESIFSHFSLFKVLVAVGKEQEAIECISALVQLPSDKRSRSSTGSDVDTRHALISLAAQHALEKSQRGVAMATLHHLASTGQNDKAKLTAYRCLIRLYLTICDGLELTSNEPVSRDVEASSEENGGKEEPMEDALPRDRSSLMEAAIECVKNAHQVLINLKKNSKLLSKSKSLDEDRLLLPGNESHVITEEEFDNEVTWFMKITWNMALQFNKDPGRMKSLFLLCKEILALSEADQSILLRQKTCLLMCAACGLACARNTNGKAQTDDLNEVLCIVRQCREICSDLAAFQHDASRQKEDKSALLLSLYHFEALAKLTKPTNKHNQRDTQALQILFQEIQQLPQTDAKTFETIAALSTEAPACHPELCKQALQVSLKYINIYLERETGENERLQLIKKRSALYRLLIDTILNEGSPSDPSDKHDCWLCFSDIYQLIQQERNSFPEVDSLWFAIRSWNVGVRLFIADHVVEAEKWCSLALRLVALFDRFRESYETHMNHAYREILAKKDIVKSNMSVVF